MSWSRFDDRWVDRPVWESVDMASRWHYLALVQSCSRNGRFDGVMPLSRALRVSDVDQPDECHAVLEAHGLIGIVGGDVRVVEIDEHIPPPSIRENAERSRIRMARHRRHKNGDHSTCLPDSCEEAGVTEVVTRNTRTGQDGLLREPGTEENEAVTRNDLQEPDGRESPSSPTCPHGVVNGDVPDPWDDGRVGCARCAVEVGADGAGRKRRESA